jgi:hypothetical protein
MTENRKVGRAVLVCAFALALCMSSAPSAQATVYTSTTSASFGSIGKGVCRGAAVGISGYALGQVVVAHPTGLIDSDWSTRLQVTAVPGPAADQVGYKVCNIGESTVTAVPQTVVLAAISSDSGQSIAVANEDFPSIAADSCKASVETVPGAVTNAAVTAQPNGTITSHYAAGGGLQLSAYPGPNPDQATLKACNVTAAAINPTAQSFLLASFPPTTPGAATNTSTLTFGSLGAGTCNAQTFGIPGAAPNDVVIANPIVPVGTGYSDKVMVTGLTSLTEAPNEASYKLCNVGTGTSSPASQNIRVMALHPPAPPCDPTFDLSCPTPCDSVIDPFCNADPCVIDPSARGCTKPSCGGRKATILGTKKADSLRGTKKRDVILGRGGRDVLIGAGGGDLICGGTGGDKLVGGKGDDKLFGGGGDDKLIGGPGNDRCDGGTGKDHAKGCGKLLKVP